MWQVAVGDGGSLLVRLVCTGLGVVVIVRCWIPEEVGTLWKIYRRMEPRRIHQQAVRRETAQGGWLVTPAWYCGLHSRI